VSVTVPAFPSPTQSHLQAVPPVSEADRRVRSIDELLAEVRTRIDRYEPVEAAERVAAGALLVDTRSAALRAEQGAVPGALVVERNVLEWRLDPRSEWRLPEITGYDVEILVICAEGYSSSLVADTLRTLGHPRSADVIGGVEAWIAAGLPVDRGTEPLR
jgi:rhodanese-related sulfurtransferase